MIDVGRGQAVAAGVGIGQPVMIRHLGARTTALHYFPARVNSSAVPIPAPSTLIRSAWAAAEWLHWRMMKNAEDAQRRELGLPRATVRCARRIVEGGALEIQAYDQLFFPGLAEEWGGTRPFVGALSVGEAVRAPITPPRVERKPDRRAHRVGLELSTSLSGSLSRIWRSREKFEESFVRGGSSQGPIVGWATNSFTMCSRYLSPSIGMWLTTGTAGGCHSGTFGRSISTCNEKTV